jgi:ubiquinone/menaquinone biosynthesis C-methylase UbiE
MILDVGCGTYPRGDVNCDLFICDTGHRTGLKERRDKSIKPREVKNFVLCDGQYLPFKDSSFEQVVSIHLIEHVNDPWLLLKEIIRVSSDKVTIRCPHRLGDRLRGKNPFHTNFLNIKWFAKALTALGCRFEIHYSKYLYFPHHFVTILRFPLEMHIKAVKDD